MQGARAWCAVRSAASAADVVRQLQALDDLATEQVTVDDLVDVALVDEGVPGAFGVDHGDRAARTAVQAAGLVDPHATLAVAPGRGHTGLAMVETGLSGMVGAGRLAVDALVQAKEDVTLVIGHSQILVAASGPHWHGGITPQQ